MPSFKKNKKGEKDADALATTETQQQRERSDTGSDASIPEIVVGTANEKTTDRDLEKGSERV